MRLINLTNHLEWFWHFFLFYTGFDSIIQYMSIIWNIQIEIKLFKLFERCSSNLITFLKVWNILCVSFVAIQFMTDKMKLNANDATVQIHAFYSSISSHKKKVFSDIWLGNFLPTLPYQLCVPLVVFLQSGKLWCLKF